MKIKVACLVCGKKIERYPSVIKPGRGTYCSRECVYKRRVTDETKRKMSEAKKGKPSPHRGMKHNEASRRNMSLAHKGKSCSEATRQKMSMAHKGKVLSEDTRIKMRKPKTEEHKRKISEAKQGHEVSADTRAKISEANKGRVPWNKGETGIYSADSLQKMREARIGTRLSGEHKRKISESEKGRPSPNKGVPMSEEAKRRLSEMNSGENHPQWRGGISFEPYSSEFNGALKDMIRERDGWTCQGCDKTQREEGKRLAIHHIDYDKLDNDSINLVAVCGACNAKANYNRPYWTGYYVRKMEVLVDG